MEPTPHSLVLTTVPTQSIQKQGYFGLLESLNLQFLQSLGVGLERCNCKRSTRHSFLYGPLRGPRVGSTCASTRTALLHDLAVCVQIVWTQTVTAKSRSRRDEHANETLLLLVTAAVRF